VGGVVRVQVPSWMRADDVDRHVAELVPRLERRFRSSHVDLPARAAELARRFGLPRPATVVWAENQHRQWGSCNVQTGEIRISIRLADHPTWVLDYVLVHELAHLVHADHSAAFKELVDQYRLAERARGFLMAKDDTSAAPPHPPHPPGPSSAPTPAPVARPRRPTSRPPAGDQLQLGF